MKKEEAVLNIQRSIMDRGLHRYEAFDDRWMCPVGVVYIQTFGTQNGKTGAMLVHIDVLKGERRKGVATALHKEIMKHVDLLTTNHISKAGKEFLKAMGYRYNPHVDTYYCWGKR